MKKIIITILALFFAQCSNNQQQITLSECLTEHLMSNEYHFIKSINRITSKDTIVNIHNVFDKISNTALKNYIGDSIFYLRYEKYTGKISYNKTDTTFFIEYLISTKKSNVNKYLYQLVSNENVIEFKMHKREIVILLNDIIVRTEIPINIDGFLSEFSLQIKEYYINSCSACNCN